MTSSISKTPERTAAELRQLIYRLESTFLSPEHSSPTLLTNEFERARLQNNLAYGFILYNQLQKSLPTLCHPVRQKIQHNLATDQDMLDLLQARLNYLNDYAVAPSDPQSLGPLANLIPAPTEKETVTPEIAIPAVEEPADATLLTPMINVEFLRPRNTRRSASVTPSSPNLTPTSDPSDPEKHPTATTPSRETLFASSKPLHSTPLTNSATAEAIMDAQRWEQEELLSSISAIALNLKQSALGFSELLETDKETVRRAVEGINKTEESMRAAERRMAMLTRVSEGMGWWDRKMLLVYNCVLMVVLVLFVFVGPKLRF